MPSGPAVSTAASQSRSVWSSSSSRCVRQESSLMTAAYCPCPARRPDALPGTVGPRARIAPELLDLGPHVGEVDGGGDEGHDRQEVDQLYAVHNAAQADNGRHAEGEQPDRLGLLARRGECLGGPAQRVYEGPRLDGERRQRERLEEPEEWGHSPGAEHPPRLSGPDA